MPNTLQEAVANAYASFRTIDHDYAPQRRLAAVVREMQFMSMALPEGAQRPGMLIAGPSGAGKSRTAEKAAAEAAAEVGALPDRGPVRIVTLDPVGTVKALWSSVLEHLGDPHWASGSEATLRKRVLKALKREGVEVLVIDEFNHSCEKSSSPQVVNTIKNLLTIGAVSVVVVGTAKELRTLPGNEGFDRRLVKHPGLPDCTWQTSSE